MDEPHLFDSVLESRVERVAPLAARMRPATLDDIVGQDHLLSEGSALRRLVEADAASSIVLWGPPGTGKTSIAEVIASTTRRHFVRLSAVSSGVKEVRETIDAAKRRLQFEERGTVVFIDEIHRFNTTQQDSLLHAVENGIVSLVGATTENPAFSVNPALRSRSSVFGLRAVPVDSLVLLCRRAAGMEGRVIDDAAALLIAQRCTGDARQAITVVEMCCAIAGEDPVGIDHVEQALNVSVSRLGRDDHYDVASAFIKSMRAGEVDTALHWLARQLDAGEDPRFIARRLVIFASEDIGEAEPSCLSLAVAAAAALDRVGLPEARYNLAQAVVHLSRAPKSRSVAAAIEAASDDVRAGRTAPPPSSTSTPPGFRPLGYEVPRYYRDGDETN